MRKPFKPEDRKCKECGDEFFASKPVWLCRNCHNKKAAAVQRNRKEMGMGGWVAKEPYPMSEAEKKKKFDRLKSKLNKIYDRKEWQKFLSDKLDEIMSDIKLMNWVMDRRDGESRKEKNVMKYGVDIKEHPSTKQMPYDI